MKSIVGTLFLALGLAGPVLSRWVQSDGTPASEAVAVSQQAPPKVDCVPKGAPEPCAAAPAASAEPAPTATPVVISLAELFGTGPASAQTPQGGAVAADTLVTLAQTPGTADEKALVESVQADASSQAAALAALAKQSSEIDAAIADLEAQAAKLQDKLEEQSEGAEVDASVVRELATRIDTLRARVGQQIAERSSLGARKDALAHMRGAIDDKVEKALRAKLNETVASVQESGDEPADPTEVARERQQRIQELMREREELLTQVQQAIQTASQEREGAMSQASRAYEEAMRALQSEREEAASQRAQAMQDANRVIEEAQREREGALRQAQQQYEQAIQAYSQQQQQAAGERQQAIQEAQQYFQQSLQEAERARTEAQRQCEQAQREVQVEAERKVARVQEKRSRALEESELTKLRALGYSADGQGEANEAEIRKSLEAAARALERSKVQVDTIDEKALAEKLRSLEKLSMKQLDSADAKVLAEKLRSLEKLKMLGDIAPLQGVKVYEAQTARSVPAAPSTPGGCCCCCCRGTGAGASCTTPEPKPTPDTDIYRGAYGQDENAKEKIKYLREWKEKKSKESKESKPEPRGPGVSYNTPPVSEPLVALQGALAATAPCTDAQCSHSCPAHCTQGSVSLWSQPGNLPQAVLSPTPEGAFHTWALVAPEGQFQAAFPVEGMSWPNTPPAALEPCQPPAPGSPCEPPAPQTDCNEPDSPMVWVVPEISVSVPEFSMPQMELSFPTMEFSVPDPQFTFPTTDWPQALSSTEWKVDFSKSGFFDGDEATTTASDTTPEASSGRATLDELLRLMHELKSDMQELRDDVRALRDDVKELEPSSPSAPRSATRLLR